MAILKIITYPEPVLSHPSEDVSFVDKEIHRLIEDMAETMYDASGVGLAAPQVGVSKRIIVVNVDSGRDTSSLICLVNPQILKAEGEEASEEGCLSIPDFIARISRPSRITVDGLDLSGKHRVIEAEGLLARALQHEIDHTKGLLIIDRLKGLKKEMVRKKLRKQIKKVQP